MKIVRPLSLFLLMCASALPAAWAHPARDLGLRYDIQSVELLDDRLAVVWQVTNENSHAITLRNFTHGLGELPVSWSRPAKFLGLKIDRQQNALFLKPGETALLGEPGLFELLELPPQLQDPDYVQSINVDTGKGGIAEFRFTINGVLGLDFTDDSLWFDPLVEADPAVVLRR